MLAERFRWVTGTSTPKYVVVVDAAKQVRRFAESAAVRAPVGGPWFRQI